MDNLRDTHGDMGLADRETPSFETIAVRLSAPLLRYLRRYTGDRALAEDLLQETLLRIARGLSSFSGRASLRTWAFSIATHVAADHFRKSANRMRIVDIEEAGDVPDTGEPVDERLVVDEMNGCIRKLIDSLPADYRAALVLHDLEELDSGAVARICGCSMATAKIRIHRARGRLREALRRECRLYRDRDETFRCERKTA